jgi:SAM-dependent methyltransferase
MDWHARYTQQAQWTAQTRRYLFERARLESARRVIEVGCGTGALLGELPGLTRAQVHGIDINFQTITQAYSNAPKSLLNCSNGEFLPFPDQSFDVAFCHFLLLWVKDPVCVLSEMHRVTRRGGAVIALAEPDYDGRIDYPPALEPLGRWQTEALQRQGADVDIGRKLRGLFVQAGIQPIEMGIIAGGWSDTDSAGGRKLEWEVLRADLRESANEQDIQKMKKLDEAAWQNGERVLFVPTFYTWGII